MSTTTVGILYDAFPSMDEDVFEYINGVLDGSKDDFQSSEEVYDALGEMLHEISAGSKDKTEIIDICEKLLKAVKLESDGGNEETEHKILNAPIHLGKMAEEFETRSEEVKSIWMKQRDPISLVDQKKLGKAEARLKQKQEKRENVEKTTVGTQYINKAATAVQAMSKKDNKLEAKGNNRSKDIKISNFDVAFGDKVLLLGADLTLVYGRRYGMVGRNGIGKSTLLRMISGGHLKIPSHISILHVEQEVVGDDTTALESVLQCDEERQSLLKEEKELTAKIHNIGESEEIDMNARLAEVYAQLQQIEADKAPARASVILAGLGFTPKMQQTATREFSGGWRMRIALARALFSKPDLLLLDEPTNMLDMKAIIWLENYLQNWPTTLLVVSHDRKFLDTVPTDIIHFHSQRMDAYRGNYENFVKAMTEKLKCQQREYEAQQQYRAHVQVFIDKFRYNAKRASLVQSKIKMLEKLPEVKPVTKEAQVTLRFTDPEALSPPILQLDDVSFSYVEGQPVLRNVNLSANMESRICIVGDNGSGKTTLLKLLTNELDPTKGIRHAHRNLVIGYFTQHHVDQLDMNLSSVEFLAKKFPGKPVEEYRRQLGRFGISGDLALQSVASLSGGQKSRVAFAAMSVPNPHFLVLDEPTNHLDVETVEALGDALNKYKGGLVLVSHDQQLIELVCKELWVCSNGSVTSISGGFSQYRKLVEQELAAQN
ncbi:ATP-binding cassette sub-family F member 3-like isoform X1 [Centruroides sculpturatus]|uniref:ATP-binding cassette sub-family F member 3-like isoform X1 n=3 Tax=Centruroides sculpturatus TaxID=218467 RepID=UPI000C6DB119|nr:ATP-binding cassette sub-family F member 3-like isoform X1 [Centruroides sculpturatus]